MTQKYEVIDAEYAEMPGGETGGAPAIIQMCEWLGVSKSGYYEWRSRPQSAAGKRRELLKIKIKALFEANNEEYGYRRMHAALARGGEQACPELVRQLMRELGLEPCQPKPWRHSLTEQGAAGPIPDLVNRDFSAGKPGEKMVGDITYIQTWQGWLYLATVIDCATRKMVGWAMDDSYKTPLISDAIKMAARNLDLPEGAIFHSDRGSNRRVQGIVATMPVDDPFRANHIRSAASRRVPWSPGAGCCLALGAAVRGRSGLRGQGRPAGPSRSDAAGSLEAGGAAP